MKFLARLFHSYSARSLSRHGYLSERERIRAKARQMNVEMGREIPKALR